MRPQPNNLLVNIREIDKFPCRGRETPAASCMYGVVPLGSYSIFYLKGKNIFS